ncbi:MAG TPA: NADH-quinone oxidoreductase subunit NuoK [Pyrinomonadaceae bacterium]
MENNLLSLIIFAPLAGAAINWFVGRRVRDERFIGVVGVMLKRNVISMFMCIELMLNAVNLTFVAFSSFFRDVSGQLFVFIVMTVAAAEAAVGLGIIIAIFRTRESLDVDDSSSLKL